MFVIQLVVYTNRHQRIVKLQIYPRPYSTTTQQNAAAYLKRLELSCHQLSICVQTELH